MGASVLLAPDVGGLVAKESIAFRLESDVMAKLEKLAQKEGVSKSNAARKIIEAGLNSIGDDDVKTESAKIDELMETMLALRLREEEHATRIDEKYDELKALLEEKLDALKDSKVVKVAADVPMREPTPDSPSLRLAKQIDMPPKKDDGERRADDRPAPNNWVTIRGTNRSIAHYVTEISRGGYLYFACGQDDSATRYRLGGTSSKRCPNCEAKIR